MNRIPILVTGGAGYIGSHTCKLLSQSGYLPITFDNFSQGHYSFVKWGPYFEGNLCDPVALDQAFKIYKPKAVFHFAARALVSESESNPALYYKNNVLGSFNLMEACVKHGVEFFVFSSTCATYGVPKNIPLSEETVQLPINPYGRSKKMIEEMLLDFDKAYGLKSIFLRYFNAAGADLEGEIGENHAPETHLIPIVIEAALGKRSHISVFGTDFSTPDGSAVRDYIHVLDLASAHIQALKYLEKTRQTAAFNLGTGKGFSVWEIIKAVELYAGRFIKIQIENRRAGDPPILIADNKRAKEILEWSPNYSDLETILSSAWKWHEKEESRSETKISLSVPSR
jgi:UDP-arabinose 4-epimerase